MTVDEAIARAEEVAVVKTEQAREAQLQEEYSTIKSCKECADEHMQLAGWLTELKQLREQTRWISCDKRQPKENGNYLAFYRTSDGTASLEFMMVDHCNAGGGWLHEEYGRKAYKKVIAWMPLPKAYKAAMESEERVRIHTLKIQPKYFTEVLHGKKNFELRKDDRNYQVGDLIILREYENGAYTGREIKNLPICYILRDCPEFGLKEGYCILGL